MQVKITLVDTSLPLPSYATSGAVALDLYSRVDLTIQAHELARIPLNVIIEVPKQYSLVIVPRSSLPAKKGLIIPHGAGIIDQDYHGSSDEILAQVYNITNEEVTIQKGERIFQALFLRCDRVQLVPTKQIKITSRGGFGSSQGYATS